MTITEFLLACIAEDEAVANEIDGRGSSDASRMVPTLAGGAHVAATPARVLAECEAKRRIVELHQPARSPHDGEPDGTCHTCADLGPDGQGWPCDTLAALASVYADHPDYRSEWRP